MIQKNKYRKLKEQMIREQIMERGVHDEGILEAFWQIERHHFVDAAFEEKSYSDAAIPIQQAQTISQPFMVAKMSEALHLEKGMKVLEIGTGSGFQAAILAYLGAELYSIERHAILLENARKRFSSYGLTITTMLGDGTIGWASKGPFDRIITTAGSPNIPDSLFHQLANDAFMLIPVGDRKNQELLKIRKKDGKMIEEKLLNCRFVPLIGKEGWMA